MKYRNSIYPHHSYRFIRIIALILTSFTFLMHPNAQLLSHRQGELIVQFKEGYGMEANQVNSLSNRSKTVISKIQPVRKLVPAWNIWLTSFDFTRIKENDLIAALSALPEVIVVQKNHINKARLIPNDPFFDSQWHHYNVQNPLTDFDSEKAWDLTTGGLTEYGDTIVVCIIDDGIEINHEDLKPNLWTNTAEIPGNSFDDDQNGYVDDMHGWNSYKGNDQFDNGKHGTPVTGLAAAAGNNGLGIAGICWNVKIMFVQGGGDQANALESYAYPLQMRRMYNQSLGKRGAFVVAVNSSWGSDYGKPEDAPLWCAVFDSLGSEGLLSVASTANLAIDVDIDGDLPTACESEFLITVTNMNNNNLKDPGAAFGKKSIDLGAYGEQVYSTYINNSYRNFSGTSAASPQVLGAVALIYSLPCSNLTFLAHTNPPEAAREVKKILLNSTRPNNDIKNTTVSGGVLNLHQALLTASPLHVVQASENMILMQWDANLLYPIQIRYRIKNQSLWKDTTIYAGQQILLSDLESCTEYELQYKNACNRNSNNYSPTRIYKTAGCCDAPANFKILENTVNKISLSYTVSDNEPLVALLKLSEATSWDTIVFQANEEVVLINLEECSKYDFIAYSFCNGKISPLSALYTFITDGCGQCTRLDYCKRFRPSSDLEWLDAIQIGNEIFKSGNNLGYGNFVGSNQSWTLLKNNAYTFSFFTGYVDDSSDMVVAAWIDYNQDGNFDMIENLASPTEKFVYSKSYTHLVPSDAKSGLTRMRVALKYAEVSDATPLSCFQSIEFGEYEDYCIRIATANCDNIESLQLNSIKPDRAEIIITHPTANLFNYAYRKLYEPEWVQGLSFSKILKLNNLDSCSWYELKVDASCADNHSEVYEFRFKTIGTNCTTSTNEPSTGNITISPNPFSNQLFVTNPDNAEILTARLYSMDGKLIVNQKVSNNQSSIRLAFDVRPGFYLLQLVLKNGKTISYRVINQ